MCVSIENVRSCCEFDWVRDCGCAVLSLTMPGFGSCYWSMMIVIVLMMPAHVSHCIAMVLEESIADQAHTNVSIGCDRYSDK